MPPRALVLSLCIALSCATDGEPQSRGPASLGTTESPVSTTNSPQTASDLERLTSVERAVRISMAIRGIRPSPLELDRVQADAEVIPELVDEWLHSDEFAEVVRDLHAEITLVRADNGDQLPSLGPMAQWSQGEIYASASEAPLKLAEEIVMNDLPYTELVTADYTMADEIVATAYGLPYDPEGPEWQHTTWTDGRPNAGILTSSHMWRRHVSNANNFHRARANMIGSMFLCDDIAKRHVDFDALPITADNEAVADALMTDPACIACHQVLDPLAAFLWGFKRNLFAQNIQDSYEEGCTSDLIERPDDLEYVDDYCYPVKFFRPTNENNWDTFGLRPPGFYGTPAQGLDELGQLIASDPRYAACTTRRFLGWLTQHDHATLPTEVVEPFRQRFVEGGLRARELVRDIVLSDTFASRATTDSTDWAPDLQATRPEQLARSVEALTGFAWRIAPQSSGGPCEPKCWVDVDLMRSDDWGYRSLAGGIDGKFHPLPTHASMPTKVMTWDRFLTEAAAYVVETDLALDDRSARRLLTEVDGTEEGGDAVHAQLALLHRVILSEDLAPDDEELGHSLALFDAALDLHGSPEHAWTLVISALLQDPRMAWY